MLYVDEGCLFCWLKKLEVSDDLQGQVPLG